MKLTQLITAVLLAAPGIAHGHHVVSESGIAWVEPVTVVELEVESLAFEYQDDRGNALVTALSAQVQILPWLALTLRAPAAWVRFEDGRQAIGNGDLEFGARGTLFASEHGELIVSAGLSAEAPTGVAEDALGGGHWALAPYMVGSTQFSSNWLMYGVVSLGLSIPSETTRDFADDNTPHGAPFSLHASRELKVRLMAAYLWTTTLYTAFGASADVPVMPFNAGPTAARLELGFSPVQGLRLALGGEASVLGPVRAPWRARSSVAWQW